MRRTTTVHRTDDGDTVSLVDTEQGDLLLVGSDYDSDYLVRRYRWDLTPSRRLRR